MRSSTSSEGPRLVRFAFLRAQKRVAIEMHPQTNGAKRHISRGQLSRPPSLERSERQGLFFVIA